MHRVAEGLFGNAAQRCAGDAVRRHVALQLHREELGGDHQAHFAIPVGQAIFGGHRVERAARVLVEAHRDADVILARRDRLPRADHRRATGGAAVADVDEGQAGQAQFVDQRVGVARGIRTAEAALHVGPVEPGIGQRLADRESALLQAGAAIGAAEGMDADADDIDISHGQMPDRRMG